MSFLAPLYLMLAGAVAIPLFLHLRRRRIENKVDFPAVRYLERAEKENVRQLKVRNLLLMFLRIAAVLAIAFAAARPIGAFFGAGHVPSALAIVLDNSLSTSAIVNGQPLLATLRERALEAANAASRNDRVWLVTVDGTVTGGSLDAVRQAITRTDVHPGRGDLANAITRGAGLVVGSGMEGRQVVVATDAQASTWNAPIATGDVRLSVLAPAGEAPRNRAVVLAEARPSRWTPRGTVVARAQLPDSATYRIALGERTLARGTARGGEDLTVRAAPPERGWQAGVVELEPDELRADDTRFFAVWLGAAPLVRPEPTAGPFLRTAVDALVQDARVALGGDIALAPADGAVRLPALLLAPADPTRLGAANRTLERLGLPWRFGAPRRDETAVRGDKFDGVRATLRYPLEAQTGATGDTLATAGGAPWIVAGDGFVIIGSPLDPAATDLPLRASFVPWLGDIIAQRLAGTASADLQAAPGAAMRVPSGTDGLEGPDGQVTPLTASSNAPSRAGVYFLRRGTARVGALVVNAEPEESDLARLPLATLRDRVRTRDALVTADAAEWRRSLFNLGARRPLQLPLILLALALLAAETLVVRRDERRRSAA
ncbi:MAG: BatA and WFA domain-containing protein [Gemmatimonadaceae bacterium]|nr:BatA and WFA domain-containing protein [Gemmatimonadota bacterium]MCC7322512.1 BatA and WFA domain-containing protein [Gemmatimonadaceae bacterium]MBK6841437.1 BatA and WFA domain-containing protein [Gemmatimonadota bacterium]MBK8061530.1 BatA and WFA domain-containing protein [Gemmatimonadota bacterium]MBK8645172.1 BatA and WFA domain-containing protein [Gemmatimonadota bacterium]